MVDCGLLRGRLLPHVPIHVLTLRKLSRVDLAVLYHNWYIEKRYGTRPYVTDIYRLLHHVFSVNGLLIRYGDDNAVDFCRRANALRVAAGLPTRSISWPWRDGTVPPDFPERANRVRDSVRRIVGVWEWPTLFRFLANRIKRAYHVVVIDVDKSLGPAVIDELDALAVTYAACHDGSLFAPVQDPTEPERAFDAVRTAARGVYTSWRMTSAARLCPLVRTHMPRFIPLLKLHKPTPRVRPTIACVAHGVNAFTSLTIDIFSRWLSVHGRHLVRDLDKTVAAIHNVRGVRSGFVVDVVSMFPTIPRNVVTSAMRSWRFPEPEIVFIDNLLRCTYFQWFGIPLRQVTGVFIGFGGAPSIANFVLCTWEARSPASPLRDPSVLFYARLLDDALVLSSRPNAGTDYHRAPFFGPLRTTVDLLPGKFAGIHIDIDSNHLTTQCKFTMRVLSGGW